MVANRIVLVNSFTSKDEGLNQLLSGYEEEKKCKRLCLLNKSLFGFQKVIWRKLDHSARFRTTLFKKSGQISSKLTFPTNPV